MFKKVNNNRGFSLVEMIIVMALFIVVIGITGDAFNRIVSKSLSLTNSAESNIAGIVGLEILRTDIESAGYGLPWSFSQPITYSEAADNPGLLLNDNGRTYSTDSAQNNIPRAVLSIDGYAPGDDTETLGGTDVLTVRAQTIATNATAKRWTYVESEVLPTVNPSPVPHTWTSDNLLATDRVIVMQPIAAMKPTNQLVAAGSASSKWSATFDKYDTIGKPAVYNDAEKKSDAFIIYGVNDDTDLRMPFNRADYYVRRPATTENSWIRLPNRCHPGTGVLFKGVVGQASGQYQELPLLECVLDMQVVYSLRTSGSASTIDVSDISGLTPEQVREQVKEVQVYILTHVGGKDLSYTNPNSTIVVGPGSGSGRTIDFTTVGNDWQNYRWKVYRTIARPRNLAGNVAQ